YSGEHGNDEANIQKLLKNLENVPEEKRTARFVCTVCVCFPDGRKVSVDGKCEGKIGFEKHGNNGFGYDPVFMVGEKSFAELSAEEKDKISHRGNALRKLAEVLPDYLK
ncbi:MAG: non-canonical purine NTP pyrophosphatase, partial [Clostridia bacterium]|nr:non-canonical purine NTP pyrophosphatase [Clostridia bacterium]